MNTLFMKAGIHPMVPPPKAFPVGGDCLDVRPHIKAVAGRSTSDSLSVEKKLDQKLHGKLLPWRFSFSFPYPFRYLWNGGGGGGKKKYGSVALDDMVLADENMEENEGRNENWILKIFHVKSLWKGRNRGKILDQENGDDEGSREAFCEGCSSIDDEKGEKIEFDRDSFSKLLKRVSLEEARLYAHLSFLGDLAYSIPQIKPKNLLTSHGLHYVTSSFEKKEQASKARKEKELAEQQISAGKEGLQGNRIKQADNKDEKNEKDKFSAYAAYEIVASAASYLHTHTKSILPFASSRSTRNKDLPERDNISTGEMASFMATTDSVTAVVSAKEEVKQAVANDLNSTHSSPCEWFICDEDKGATRYFVIKGSDSLASWQANLLFEPIKFEGLDVLVHRGIYEAAKGIYEQMLPEVHAYLKVHGSRATFRFTGHSRGGSLSLLLNLMLLIRGEVPASSLLPVVTFGAPAVMCGGDYLLHKLGLPRGHLQSITMHRDIVPRAFSCNYPNHVAELLKAVNRNFRNHPCLNKQKLLYAPMGEFLILQPDEKISPHHELLPFGSGLYLLSCPVQDVKEAEKQIWAAKNVFLNSPHPLEILRLRSSYGSNGSIKRDHHMRSYLRSIRNVIRQELNHIRKVKREKRHKLWWLFVAPSGGSSSTIMGRPVLSGNINQGQFNLYGTLQNGKESLKRFSRLVASQHMQLLVVLLFPAKFLILGVYSFIKLP